MENLVGVIVVISILSVVVWKLTRKETLLEQIQKRHAIKIAARTAKNQALLKLPMDYDPTNCGSFQRFDLNLKNSDCLFAKKAIVWGSYPWDSHLSLEENVVKSIPALARFYEYGREQKLDGFVFEVQGIEYSRDVEIFGETVRRVMRVVGDNDPSDSPMNFIDGKRGWRFAWNDHNTFVTTFAPCYHQNHARYPFNSSQEFNSCWVLFQPEWSFGIHNIGADHPWDDNKTTVRQKIRQRFREVGRPYYVPPTRFYPMAPMIVPPLDIGDAFIEWWVPLKERTLAVSNEVSYQNHNSRNQL